MPELSLRMVLIAIGVLIIVAVYLLTTARRRRDARSSFDRHFSRVNIPDVILQHDPEEETIAARPATPPPDLDETIEAEIEAVAPPDRAAASPAEPRPAARSAPPPTAASRVLPVSDEAPEDLPRVRNELATSEPDNSRRETDQMDLFGAGSAPRDVSTAAPAARAQPASADASGAAGDAAADKPDDGVISLFVRAHEGKEFGGPELVRAFNAVGMRHGDMSIFHHFGAGELSSETALFSAANMFEPGTFDLEKIEAMRTAGVVLFMQLPTELDDAVAFELMLNSAQRLAELSGGELFVTPRQVLDAESIATLRQRVTRFSARHG